MNEEQNNKCHVIIHTATASASAIAAGLAQIPGSDTIPITAIQITMIISLGGVFGRDIAKSAAESILAGAAASIGGRTVSQFLVGWIPGLGNAINAATAASITEGIGWYVANDFAKDVERAATKSMHLSSGQLIMCVIFSIVLAIVCMLADVGLEKFTVHFKIWGAVSGIILAVSLNAVIFIMCSNRGWNRQSWAIMPYSNYLAVVINIVCALVINTGKDVHSWDETIVEFFRTPLLNWGLVIIAVLWWFKVDRRFRDEWSL